MNATGVTQAYIKVVPAMEGGKIILPQGFTKKPPLVQERELLNICRKHYDERPWHGRRGKIRAYRYYFSEKDFLDYAVEEIEAVV
jgi:hypothetical protein